MSEELDGVEAADAAVPRPQLPKKSAAVLQPVPGKKQKGIREEIYPQITQIAQIQEIC